MADDVNNAKHAAYTIREMYEGLIQQAHRRDDSDRVAYGCWLTLTTLEQFRAALCLIENGMSSHAAGPVRSMLESLADLLNLAHSEGYADQMRYDSAKENVTLFDEFGKSEHLEKAMTDVLAEWDARDRPVRDELAQSGTVTKKLHLEKKLERVELEGIYVAYRVFCGMVHPNLTSLKARHDGGDGASVYRVDAPPAMTRTLLRFAVDFLTRAINVLPAFSSITEEQMKEVTDKAVSIWCDADPLSAAEAKAADTEHGAAT